MSEVFKTYLFTYRHEGAEWVLPIQARNACDARERLKGIALARYDGEAMARIDVPATIPQPFFCFVGGILLSVQKIMEGIPCDSKRA